MEAKSVLNELIQMEKNVSKEYKQMAEKTSLQNIKFFLEAFSEAHEGFADRLREIRDGVSPRLRKPFSELPDIKATDHLVLQGDPDLSSMSSTLMFIVRKEKETFAHYTRSWESIDDEDLGRSFDELLAQREQLKIKADRLYNDLIQSSY